MPQIIPHNISRSGFRKDEYVGHCNGAQRIRKGGEGWETYALGSSAGRYTRATARTLMALGIKLERLNGKNEN